MLIRTMLLARYEPRIYTWRSERWELGPVGRNLYTMVTMLEWLFLFDYVILAKSTYIHTVIISKLLLMCIYVCSYQYSANWPVWHHKSSFGVKRFHTAKNTSHMYVAWNHWNKICCFKFLLSGIDNFTNIQTNMCSFCIIGTGLWNKTTTS